MKKIIYSLFAVTILAACSTETKKTDLCKSTALDINKLTGEWNVTSKDQEGYTYIFDKGKLKKGAMDSWEMYDIEAVGSTLYIDNSALKIDNHSFCIAITDTSLLLTEINSEEEIQEAAANGNSAYLGHMTVSLKKVGNEKD